MSQTKKKTNLVIPLVLVLLFISFAFLIKSNQVQILSNTPEEITVHAQTGNCDTDFPNSWPQVAHDAQRSGSSPENLGPNYYQAGSTTQINNVDVTWEHAFQPDKIFPQVQAIVYCNKVIVGTEGANDQTASVYAFNAQTGLQAEQDGGWVTPIGSPILGSVASGGNRVYVAAMNGKVYALDAVSGNIMWEKQIIPLSDGRGFSASPLLVLAENKIMIGGRDGVFYAINTSNGSIAWQKDLGAPILLTAAFNNGKVFVGVMDMYLYALNSTTGLQVWRSKVKGMAMKDYWPVVHQNTVIVYPMGSAVQGGKVDDTAVCDANSQTCFDQIGIHLYNEANGQELGTIVHGNTPLQNGSMPPPCILNNNLVLSAQGSWSEVSLSTRLIAKQLNDGSEDGIHNGDENMVVSCTADAVFAFHVNGTASCLGGAGYSGVFDTGINNGRWTCYVPGRVSNEMHNNTQRGGGSPVSIANGFFYHIANSGITAVDSN